MSNMHFLVGISTNDYVILASDKTSFAYGAIRVAEDDDKEFVLGQRMSMLCTGEDGDVSQFGDWARRNIRLYSIRNGYELGPRSAHHWIRRGIADSLRTREHYVVDILIGGYDQAAKKAFLGSVDYLGNGLADQPYLFRGFGGRFCYAMLDASYRPNMTEQEALEVLNKCLKETKRRFLANLGDYNVVVISKDGRRSFSQTV